MTARLSGKQASDIIRTGAKSKERLQQEVGADRAMGRFHFRDSGLTGPEPLGDLRLRQAKLLTPAAQSARQRQLHLDEAALIGRQIEKIAGITDRPSGSFESSLFLSAHARLPSCVESPSRTPPTVSGNQQSPASAWRPSSLERHPGSRSDIPTTATRRRSPRGGHAAWSDNRAADEGGTSVSFQRSSQPRMNGPAV